MSATKVIKDDSEKVFKLIKQIKRGYVTIGVHEDAGSYPNGESVVQVALFNEFGTETSPERSFFRSAIDDNMDKLNAYREELLTNIFEKNWPVEKALKALGLRIQILIQNKIKSNVPPVNAPSTLEQKAHKGTGQRTLIDSTLLLRSITYKIKL